MTTTMLQYELWTLCKLNCIFCYNDNIINETELMLLNNLNKLIDLVKNDNIYNEYELFGLIGGEFFAGLLKTDEICNKFFEAGKIINLKLTDNKLKLFHFTTTLIKTDINLLFSYLQLFSDNLEKVYISTSYDVYGRFHTESQEAEWKHNMLLVKQKFPTVKFVTNIILSGNFILSYLDDVFNLTNFKTTYDTYVFLKPPVLAKQYYLISKTANDCLLCKLHFNKKYGCNFYPTRDLMLKFLTKFRLQQTEKEYDELYSFDLRANNLILQNYTEIGKYDMCHRDKINCNETLIAISNDIDILRKDFSLIDNSKNQLNLNKIVCNHTLSCQSYVDSTACFLCDKDFISTVV